MKLVLHNYWRSSASHRVRIGLGLKGLAYEYVVVNIVQAQQHAELYRAKNPMAQVPTLELTEDDGTVRSLSQSLPILEYLDERWPSPPILPKDPYLRARTRALAEIVNSGIQPLQNLTTTQKINIAASNQPLGLGAYGTARDENCDCNRPCMIQSTTKATKTGASRIKLTTAPLLKFC